MPEASLPYADKLWDILNAITAFAAVQGVVVGVTDWRRLKHDRQAIIVAITLTVVMAALYVIAVSYLTADYYSIAKPSPQILEVLNYVFRGRIVTILLFGLYAGGALFGGYRTTVRPE